jgi:hypothetical protein
MSNRRLLVAATLAVLAGCSRPTQLKRITADGGTVLLGSGDPGDVTWKGLSIVSHECSGVFEVTEIGSVAVGAVGGSYTYGGFTSSSAQFVDGTTITYLCRKPASTVLYDRLVVVAEPAAYGKGCSDEFDCPGKLSCRKRVTRGGDESRLCLPAVDPKSGAPVDVDDLVKFACSTDLSCPVDRTCVVEQQDSALQAGTMEETPGRCMRASRF